MCLRIYVFCLRKKQHAHKQKVKQTKEEKKKTKETKDKEEKRKCCCEQFLRKIKWDTMILFASLLCVFFNLCDRVLKFFLLFISI